MTMSSRALVEAALAQVETVDAHEALRRWRDDPATRFVDLREAAERAAAGTIPGALHVPRGVLEFQADPTSPWHRAELSQPGVRLLLFCAIGWRSALAAQTLDAMGVVPRVAHVGGGFDAWRAAGGPVAAPPMPIPTAPGPAPAAAAEPGGDRQRSS